MSVFRYIMPLVLLFLIELYFYPAIKKKLNKRFLKFAYWSVTALTVILLVAGAFKPSVLWPRWAGVYVVGSLMIILFSKVIASLVLLFVDLFRLCRWSLIKVVRKSSKTEEENNISRSDFLNKVALYSAAIPLAGFVYGMIKTVFDYKVHKIKLPFKNLPRAFNGLKIVQISDIHSGTYVNQGPLETAIKIINDEKPDIIFFTGDLVNEIALEAYPYKHQLGSLNAPLGVFSILGNHDYGDYFRWNNIEDKKQNLIDLKNFQKDLGWNLLLNENRIIEKNGEKIAIVGVENWGSAMRFPRIGDVAKAKKGTEEVMFKILLSHDPSHWQAKVLRQHEDMDLMLSGHTHGMQLGVEIKGFKWSPSKYFYPQWAGLYTEGKQHLYVNRGLGVIGYPGRIGIQPEITVIELLTEA